MIWLILVGYILGLALLWVIMQWDAKGRTLLSLAVLMFYACALLAIPVVTMMVCAIAHAPPVCTCEMVKNHECP